jgi:hypothetical protein
MQRPIESPDPLRLGAMNGVTPFSGSTMTRRLEALRFGAPTRHGQDGGCYEPGKLSAWLLARKFRQPRNWLTAKADRPAA